MQDVSGEREAWVMNTVLLYLDVLQLDELEHLDDGGVEEVVPVIVRDESVHHRSKRFSLN